MKSRSSDIVGMLDFMRAQDEIPSLHIHCDVNEPRIYVVIQLTNFNFCQGQIFSFEPDLPHVSII